MAVVGRFGDVIFQTGWQRVLTFNSFNLKQALKTSEHEVAGWKGRLEITGEELDEVTLHIQFVATLGVPPRYMLERLRMLMRLGCVDYLIVGNWRVMDRRCLITDISSEWMDIYQGGEVSRIEADVTFKEYN